MASHRLSVLPKIGETKEGFRVRYRENGVLRSEYLPTRAEAVQRQAELMNLAAATIPQPIKLEGSGEPEDWRRILWELAVQVLNSPERPERKLTVISSAAKSAHGFVDLAKIRQMQAEVRRQVAEIRRLRKDGVRPTEGTGAAAGAAPGTEPIQ